MAELTDQQKVNILREAYFSAYYAWNGFYDEAANDMRMYEGVQWDDNEKKRLNDEGRHAYVFNKIRSKVDLITGYQRQNRLSSVVMPREDSDQNATDQMSKILLYVLSNFEGYHYISDAFTGACQTGWNLLDIYVDYTKDPVNGDISFGRTPYSGFITDPYFTRRDLQDCNYVIKRKYLSPDQVKSLLPKQEKDVEDLAVYGWERDEMFPWLPYQREPSGQEMMAYNEMYSLEWNKEDVLVDMQTGEYTHWEGDKDTLRELVQRFPQLKITKMPVKAVKCDIIVNDVHMRTEVNRYGLNDYPFTPFMAYFQPEGEFWGQKLQSLVRQLIDPQREVNRRRSQMIDILDSQVNSGWIATEDAVVNPESLFQTAQGKVIWRKQDAAPGSLEKIPPGQIDGSMFQLNQLFENDMQDILGLNAASFGEPASGNESGIMMMLRQGAAITGMQDLFDNLRFAQKNVSEKVVKLIRTWTPEKMQRILNQEADPKIYDKDFMKYDISIQEGMLTDTQKQMYFRQLVDLRQLGAPVTGEMLAKAAPIQGKQEYTEQIAQIEQQQAQQAQQQAQIQEQERDALRQERQAKAISELNLAKERATRAQANLGLESERESESIENRANAAYDRARAIKELEAMDDARLMKYIQMMRLLEQRDKTEAEIEERQNDIDAATDVRRGVLNGQSSAEPSGNLWGNQ